MKRCFFVKLKMFFVNESDNEESKIRSSAILQEQKTNNNKHYLSTGPVSWLVVKDRTVGLIKQLNDAYSTTDQLTALPNYLTTNMSSEKVHIFDTTLRDGEQVPAVRTPIRIDGQPAPVSRAAPRLGEHQAEPQHTAAGRHRTGDQRE